MSFENFDKVRVNLNNINKPIYDKLLAKEGDLNGRQLEVQIIDGNSAPDFSNLNLNFYWKHLKHGNQGIEPFEAVDRDKGIFKVSYPESMLNAGKVSAFIKIQANKQELASLNLVIQVEGSGFDALAVVASDDYAALNEALQEINMYQVQIDDIKDDIKQQARDLLDSESREFDSLQNEYKNLFSALQSQFDDAVANVTEDSEVITARTSRKTGESFDTVGKRLDEIEVTQTIENKDTDETSKVHIYVENGQLVLESEENE